MFSITILAHLSVLNGYALVLWFLLLLDTLFVYSLVPIVPTLFRSAWKMYQHCFNRTHCCFSSQSISISMFIFLFFFADIDIKTACLLIVVGGATTLGMPIGHPLVADCIAQSFFDFVDKHKLADTLISMSAQQIQVIAIYLSHLQQKPPKRVHISERLDLIQRKPTYTPVEDIASPEIPHFVRSQSETIGATMQAPVICQLCGAGFLSQKALWAHAAQEHHSWAEARKRLIFEVQQRISVPLQPIEKRRLASNFMHDLLYSYPGRNTVRPDECTMRQIVACAVCAIKDWIDDFYPCYMWKDPPAAASVETSEQDDGHDTDEDEEPARVRVRGPQLRDADGFCYFGPADKIHAFLDVNLYVPVVPLAPLEELHASTVQHPRFQTMRWLLNTQRVPVSPAADVANTSASTRGSPECIPADATGVATEHAKPACAGIGDPDKPVWICHHCASHLCSLQPRMPPQALANWNWGGRQHPKFQNLSMAHKSLLGLVKLIMRMVLLKPTDNTDESEKALVGNTILVAQPSPEMIAAQLPPTEAEQASYFNVVYGTGTAENASGKLSKKKALTINRQEYLECAKIRAERCPLFAAHTVNVAEAHNRLPEDGVPPGIMRGAVEMETMQYFAPNLSGPATNQSPFSKDEDILGRRSGGLKLYLEVRFAIALPFLFCCRLPFRPKICLKYNRIRSLTCEQTVSQLFNLYLAKHLTNISFVSIRLEAIMPTRFDCSSYNY